MRGGQESERGSASVEQAGLAALIALLLLAAIAAVSAGGEIDAGRDLARTVGNRLTCGPRLPDACRHHPLVPAYGWPLARLTRALAPSPGAQTDPGGLPLVPVDFRRCRRESCAVAAGPHLTASGRRTTAFTELRDERRSLGWVELAREAPAATNESSAQAAPTANVTYARSEFTLGWTKMPADAAALIKEGETLASQP
jgi:hypothetical protein